MTGLSDWWFNRLGTTSTAFNPEGGPAPYGLTFDTSTANWQNPQQYQTFVVDQRQAALNVVNSIRTSLQPIATLGEIPFDDSYGDNLRRVINGSSDWSDYTGLVGKTFGKLKEADAFLQGVEGKIDTGTEGAISEVGEERQSREWGNVGDVAGAAAEKPGISQTVWAIDKTLQGVKTPLIVARDDKMGRIGNHHLGTGSDWRNAWEEADHRGFGQALVESAFLEDEDLTEENLEYLRKHDVGYNLAAIGFEVVGGWKAAPEVMLGRGVGGVQNFRRGKVPTINERNRTSVMSTLTAESDEAAQAALTASKNPIDRLHARYGMNLRQRSEKMREAARTLSGEEYANLYPFRQATNGTKMAAAFRAAAGDDRLWDLTFRASLGDARAQVDIRDLQGLTADQMKELVPQGQTFLDALNATRTRSSMLDNEIASIDADILKREKSGNTSGYYRYETWLSKTDAVKKQAELDEVNDTLSRYEKHAEWFDLATDAAGGGANLKNVGTPGIKSNAFWDEKVQRTFTFQDNPYGKRHTVSRVARAPWLKKPGIIDLNRVDEGYRGVQSYFDQLRAITGFNDPELRESTLEAFQRASNPGVREKIVKELEHETMLGAFTQKLHNQGLDVDHQVLRDVISRTRRKADNLIADMTTRMDKKGRWQYLDEAGNSHTYQLPFDPTEMPNYHLTLDLQEFDAAISRDKELWSKLDTAYKSGARQMYADTMDALDTVGYLGNRVWKPFTLLRLSWAMRVVPDEMARVMMQVPVASYLSEVGQSIGVGAYNAATAIPRRLHNGRKYKVGPGPLASSGRLNTVNGDIDLDLPTRLQPKVEPTAAAPDLFADTVPKRHDQLTKVAEERVAYIRAMDKHRAELHEVEEGRPTGPVNRPVDPPWVARFNKDIADAKANSAGFTFDPVSDSATRTGFDVKVFPERDMRVPADRFTPEHLHYYTKKNADALSVRGGRVAVKYDANSGEWVLGTVRHFNRSQVKKALEFGARVNSPGIVDIGKHWRELDHQVPDFDLPLDRVTAVSTPDTSVPRPELDVADAQETVDAAADLSDEMWESVDGSNFEYPFERMERGKGTRVYRSGDGTEYKVGDVYHGDDIRASVNSGAPVWQNLSTGTTNAKDHFDRMNAANVKLEPPVRDTAGVGGLPSASYVMERKRYFEAYTALVNKHIRFSPIWRKQLEGWDDQAIVKWLSSNERDAREIRNQMPLQAGNPRRWVSEHRAELDRHLPNRHLQQTVKERAVTARDLTSLIDEADLPTIDSGDVGLLMGKSVASNVSNGVLKKLYNWIGTLPTDNLVRHPFANTLYKLEMRNYMAQNHSGVIDEDLIQKAQASAREFTTKQIRRTLYNMMDESNFTHAMRFMMPFGSAWQETLTRWARIVSDHPEAFSRMMVGWDYTNEVFNVVPAEEDAGGLSLKLGDYEYNSEDKVILSIPDWMQKIPGLQYFDKAAFDKGSANLVLQGKHWYLPSVGPIVANPLDLALDEFDNDGLPTGDNQLYTLMHDYLFPVGRPGPGLSGHVKSMSPAYARRVGAWWQGEGSAETQRAMVDIQRQMETDYETGKRDHRPTQKEIAEAAKAHAFLRIFVSFGSPVPLDFQPRDQFYIDELRKSMETYGKDGQAKFIEKYGLDYFAFTQSVSASSLSAPSSKKGLKETGAFADLIRKHPDWSGLIYSPEAYKAPFDMNVYQSQFQTEYAPGKTMRSTQTPEEWNADYERDLGWQKYMMWRSGLDAELARRGLTTLNNNGAEDLAAQNEFFKDTLSRELPEWGKDFTDRSSSVSSRVFELQEIAFDKRFDNRPDMQGLRQYLMLRDEMAATLDSRFYQGGSKNLQAGDNADLKQVWDYQLYQLTEANPMFADMYYRYLESDTLQTGGGI